ncbi:MAG: hypothetical protein ACK54Y_09090 [Bacteroidota bacterium]|jgi:hypothetical protein
MRKLFTLCLLVFTLSASAQWQQTGSKVRYVNGLGIPTKDTAAGVSADSSQILIRPADSSLYVKYKRTWMRVGGGGGSIAGSGTTNYIPKFTSSNAIGNSQIFDNGTNVGIGTASPAQKLDVNGIARVTTEMRSKNTAGNISYFTFEENANSNSATFISGDARTTGNLGLWTNSLERIRIDNNGNVGIGTTSPSTKLHVNATTSTPLIIESNQASTFLGLKDASGSFTYLGSDDGAFLVQTPSGGYSTKLIVTDAGNIGIGTTSPSSRLDVSGTATATNLSVTTNATVGGTLNVNGTTTLGTTNTGAINASSVNAPSGSGTFGNLYSNGIVQMLGVNVKYRNISATYTATTSDDYFINITTGTFTLNLPTAATPYGQVYVIKNSGTGTITVDPNGTQTIDGATTFTMNVQNGSITIIGDGTNWKIVSKYL